MNKMEMKNGLMNYEKAKALAASEDTEVRRELAARTDLQPEVLYFLAEDVSPEVRSLVASNALTPIHADLLLARDKDDGVRCGLAAKISRLMPHLGPDAQDKLRGITIEIIELLARDQLDRIRSMVTEALKNLTDAPPELIERVIKPLAWDKVLEVAAPMLRSSLLLSDQDLIEIIESEPIQGALAAIAGRTEVAGPVADAIVAHTVTIKGDVVGDARAVTTLLANPLAQIREETLDKIVAAAPQQKTWHKPLVERPTLPGSVVRRIADFVTKSLLEALKSRDDLDPKTTNVVAKAVRERVKLEEKQEVERAAAKKKLAKERAKAEKKIAKQKKAGKKKNGKMETENGKAAAKNTDNEGTVTERAVKLHKAGKLNQEALSDALLNGQRTFVAAGLAVLAKLPEKVVWSIIDSKSAKGITALAWKAGMDMRFGHQMQIRLGGIAPNQTLNPRNGVDFPIGEADMLWQIEFFGG